MSLTGKVAIVTGSSQGIGAAIAHELSLHGCSIVLNYPTPSQQSAAQSVLSRLKSANNIAVEADLSKLEGPAKLVRETVAKFGEIDILVNNASLAIFKPLELCTTEEWEQMINLNGRGYLLMTRAVLPHLRKGAPGGTRIINVTSSDAAFPTINHSIYAGTKGMQDSLTKVWARELPPKYRCTVNSVVPGPTRTPALEGLLSDPKNYGYDAVQTMLKNTPCGERLVEPEEIGYAVAMLCEDKARFINGVHIHVNGGLFID